MTKPTTSEGDTFTVEARAHLYRLRHECIAEGLWAAGELATFDPDHPLCSIPERYGIALPGSSGEESLSIVRYAETYCLFGCNEAGEAVTLAEGPAIEDVTKRWTWVLGDHDNVVAFPAMHRAAALTSC